MLSPPDTASTFRHPVALCAGAWDFTGSILSHGYSTVKRRLRHYLFTYDIAIRRRYHILLSYIVTDRICHIMACWLLRSSDTLPDRRSGGGPVPYAITIAIAIAI